MYSQKFYGFLATLALTIVLISGVWQMNDTVAETLSYKTTVAQPILSAQHSPLAQGNNQFTVPPLPYEYNALEAYIDPETMTLHHDKHHAGYVRNLNEAIALHPELQGKSVEELLFNFETIPQDIQATIRNNGGGHANHSIFWSIMTPNSQGEPTGEIASAINTTFGDFATFKTEFNDAGKAVFGSGWAWLVMNSDGSLEVISTANQDSPLMEKQYPIMGNDVWEHAYYLKYQNNRTDYLDAWWNVVNWKEVNNRLQLAKGFFE